MKQKIAKLFLPLLLAALGLFAIAAIFFGLKGGIAAFLLILATVAMLALLLEAVLVSPTFFKCSYRFALFFGLWTALFYNLGERGPMHLSGILMSVSLCGVLFSIIYYMNKYCVRDADKRLQ